ncbi:MAG: tRNA nucleotidyltransferase (CCA-adding enzyme) [Myxococcota bacterium]|jgi:tRNA nucleotidyltransferase (CCA-adding enzyme)
MDERDLINKLRQIGALYTGATTEGERIAALKAYERVQGRLEQERYTKPVEYKFTMANSYETRLFLALARKHGLRPFRYSRQRHTTVMLEASKRFVDETLWPEYTRLSEALGAYLDEVTDRVVREAVHADASDASVAPQLQAKRS